MNLLLGRGCFENKLMPRLVKVIRKYQKHFQEFSSYYLSIWNQFWEWIGWSNNKEKVNLKKIVNEKSLTSLPSFHNIKIGKDYIKVIERYWFKDSDSRADQYVLRFYSES